MNSVQNENTRKLIQRRKKVLKESDSTRLDPLTVENGILPIGGQLRRAEMEYGDKHPALLPKNNHLSKLVMLHYHNKVHHQGRQITHGAIRQASYWLVSGHRLLASIRRNCVTCKKLRGAAFNQIMADIPCNRIKLAATFTNVGFDVFGLWTVLTRKTRGGAANSKR